MPSRNVVLAYVSGGGVTEPTGVPATVQLAPPSVDRSTAIVAQQKCCLGLKLVSVVYTAPSGVTCGSRYVAPVGVCGGSGSAAAAARPWSVPRALRPRWGTAVPAWC